MNILFTVCGRAGSKGVKGKNARDFLDVPLVWYSMANIALYIEKYSSKEDTVKVVLNTDSEPLIEIVKRVNTLPVAILRREESLAGDRVPKVAVILVAEGVPVANVFPFITDVVELPTGGSSSVIITFSTSNVNLGNYTNADA